MNRAQPIYLMATSRSGTNLLRSILDAHPEITAPPPFEEAIQNELPALSPTQQRRYVRDVLVCQEYSAHGLHMDLDPEDVHRRMEEWNFYELQQALYEAHAEAADATHWMTKYNGAGFEQVPGAVDYYDDLQVVYLVRDPRDVGLSFQSTTVGPYHPYMSAGLWTLEQSIGRTMLETVDVDTHLVTYETLLEDPNNVVESLCQFLDVNLTDDVLSFHERTGTQQMANSGHMFENLSQPIMSDNYGKFRTELPTEEVRIIEKVTREAMDYFGYEPVTPSETLDALNLREREIYERRDDDRERAFHRSQCLKSPVERFQLRLWQQFMLYIYLRYVALN